MTPEDIFNKALDLDNTHEYTDAMQLFMQAAEQGVLDAYLFIAYYYNWGCGVKINEKKAFTYWKKGALKGNTACIECVAECYSRGLGVKQNYTKALQWYKKHAKTADGKNSLHIIGDFYFKGLGTKQNYKKAVKWYQMSSKLESANGHYKLGLCYQHGTGIPKDLNMAIELFTKAMLQIV